METERETERERDRERDRERETERETERDRERQRETERDRERATVTKTCRSVIMPAKYVSKLATISIHFRIIYSTMEYNIIYGKIMYINIWLVRPIISLCYTV